jgi:putative ABC transport system substrate-binding protein
MTVPATGVPWIPGPIAGDELRSLIRDVVPGTLGDLERTAAHFVPPRNEGRVKIGRRYRRLAGLAAVGLLLSACGSAGSGSPAGSGNTVKIAMFQIASNGLFDQIQAGFKQGFLQQSGLKADKVQWVVKNAQGSQTSIEAIAKQVADSDVSMIEVLGTPAVLALAHLEHRKPIIAVAMGDPVGAGVAKSLGAPGGNVTGSIDYIEPSRLLDQLIQVKPAFQRIGTIYNPSNQNMQVWVKALKSAAAARGIKVVEASVGSSSDVRAAARTLRGRADAVHVGPVSDVQTAVPSVAQVARDARQQLYLIGGDASTPGVLATLGPDYPGLGRMAGVIAGKVHGGTPPGQVPFARPAAVQLIPNSTTAGQLGVTFPASG